MPKSPEFSPQDFASDMSAEEREEHKRYLRGMRKEDEEVTNMFGKDYKLVSDINDLDKYQGRQVKIVSVGDGSPETFEGTLTSVGGSTLTLKRKDGGSDVRRENITGVYVKVAKSKK